MPKEMLLNEDQRKVLEEHGHPEAWFICTTDRCTVECDHCDEVLLILSEDRDVCSKDRPGLDKED